MKINAINFCLRNNMIGASTYHSKINSKAFQARVPYQGITLFLNNKAVCNQELYHKFVLNLFHGTDDPKASLTMHHAHKTVTYVVWTNQFDVGNLGKSRTLTLGCSYLFELHDVYFTEFCSTRGPKELLSTWKNSSFGLHDKPDWFCYSSNNQIYSYCYKQSSV